MVDNTAAQHAGSSSPMTLVELLEDATPMGDLSELAVHDLTPDEEDAFFQILEDA